jgi:hypothetical protein
LILSFIVGLDDDYDEDEPILLLTNDVYLLNLTSKYWNKLINNYVDKFVNNYVEQQIFTKLLQMRYITMKDQVIYQEANLLQLV